jgi:hydroxymethylglutaryl-CoA reductase
MALAFGKIILFGEHAVVHGRRAIAASLPIPIETRVTEGEAGAVRLRIPAWELDHKLAELPEVSKTLDAAVAKLIELTGLSGKGMTIEVTPHLTSGAGLGSSAAISVSILRGLKEAFALDLNDKAICGYAFEAEKIFHGTPSGLDNTISTYGGILQFRRGEPPVMERLSTRISLPMVVALTGRSGDTKSMVAGVRARWQKNPNGYEFLFDQVDRVVERALQALQENDLETLGLLMSINHGLLQTMGVSSKDLDLLTDVARAHGAYGAKLTGGGGGGAMISIVPPERGDAIVQAIRGAGYQAFFTTLTPNAPVPA